ncbi:uncharacterized protein LOC131619458 [Vicia villosa]|uniref:uncharacterized protein LOC131619458 n=1 Tax=Vicia villosa TaxID=3911 RepID=UPI00273B15A2|nr:uncharacterized protein LOC131619458 [Vicia villosa]
MGFGEIWMNWMEALIFSSHMSVLVNGSPTKEFVVERGLRQRDPLFPFLYVIVAEGLKGLVKKAVENGDFKSFDINRVCSIDILQFADDTLLVGDGSWNNICAIKSVLMAFEIVSGLGINHHKRKLIGVNINSNFLDLASHFLSCRLEEKKFTFLGIQIGANPRRIATWRSLVIKLKKDFLLGRCDFLVLVAD